MKKIIYSTLLIAVCAVIYYSCDNSERIVKDVDNYGTRISKINPKEYPLIKFKGYSFFFFVDKIH